MLHAIDLHKSVLQIASMCASGSGTPHQARLQASERALRGYLAQWPGVKHHIVAEATGSWYWLDDFCRDYGAELSLAHPWKLHAITGAKVKTDPADADTLLTMFRLDLIPPAHKISPELRELRDLMRLRLRLIGKQTSCMNSIARLLEKYNRTAVDELPELAQLQVRLHHEQIAGLAAQTRQLERILHRRVIPNPDVQRLLRIPGIGRINALTIYLEIDGIGRFATDRNFFSYCRLVPGAHNSAASTRSQRSRAGNRYLKLAFSHAAVRAVQAYPEIRDAYRRRLRKKNKPLAQAWVRKELARIVYHVLSKQCDFSGCFCGKQLSRVKKPQWPLRASPSQQLASAGPGLSR